MRCTSKAMSLKANPVLFALEAICTVGKAASFDGLDKILLMTKQIGKRKEFCPLPPLLSNIIIIIFQLAEQSKPGLHSLELLPYAACIATSKGNKRQK